MSVGVEQERFILKHGVAPTCTDITNLLARMARKGVCSYQLSSDHTAGIATRTTPWGTLDIKPDGFTHVLEVAFPPVPTPTIFESMHAETWGYIREAAQQEGLYFSDIGCLPDHLPNEQAFPVSALAADRQGKLLKRPLPTRTFGSVMLSSVMAATHVHLPALRSSASTMALIPVLYSYEYLVPWLFSRSRQFRGHWAHCVRPLIYRDSFADSYRAAGFPVRVPNSLETYDQLVADSESFVRDYSFIVPRSFGTVEFRTACSQASVEAILELIGLYRAIWQLALLGEFSAVPDSRSHFYAVCEHGSAVVDPAAQSDLERLRTVSESLPDEWAVFARRALSRASQVAYVFDELLYV